MKLGLGNTLLLSPVNSVPPLSERPTFGISFDRSRYTDDAGFANQASVGSSSFNLLAYNGPNPVFVRATAATFRGSNGLIQYAPENLIGDSQQFSSAGWGKTNINTTGTPSWIDVEIAPDGTQTADKLIPSSTPSTHFINATPTLSPDVHTASVYAKAAEYTALGFNTLAGGFVSDLVVFDLANGTVFSSQGNAVAIITPVGNGWFRCSVSSTVAWTGGFSSIAWYAINAPSTGFSNYSGDGTSGIYIWGAQLERSSTARPYISTTALPVHGPRFEYALDGSPLGLLLEKESQNLLQYSEVFKPTDSGNYWSTATANAVTSDQTTAPSGLVTADLLTTSATSFDCFVRRTIWVGSTQYSYSVFLKRGPSNHRYVGLYIGTGISSTQFPYFDFDNPSSVQIPSGTMVGTIDSTRVDAYSNGWYRVSVTFTTAAIPVSGYAGVYISASNGTLPSASTAGLNCYIWGIQAETAPFVTSYIPTVATVPLTRNADALNMTVGSWFNQDEGTIVVSGDRSHSPTLNASGFDSFFEFTESSGYTVFHACDGVAEYLYDSGSNAASSTGVTIGSLTAIAASYSDITDLLHISRNGNTTQSGASINLSVVPTTLNIGYAPSALIDYWNGHIKSFRYFPKAFPNKLQQYSAV